MLDAGIDGVIICSATSDHAEDVIAAAKAKKSIYVEKVLAPTSAECDRIAAAVRESGVLFTISMPQKGFGDRRTVIETAKSGELGKINFVRYRNCHNGSTADILPAHFYNARQCGGGAMIDRRARRRSSPSRAKPPRCSQRTPTGSKTTRSP